MSNYSPMILALCGQKGGSGKTTISVAISTELLRRGSSVLLVDSDPQGTLRTWGAVATERTSPDATGNEQQDAGPRRASQQGRQQAPTVVAMGPKMHHPGQLDKLAATFDYTVIDCPPRHGEIQRSALMAADIALLPCRAESPSDVWAMSDTVEILREATSLRPDLVVHAFLTQVRPVAIASTARAALESLGLTVLKTELGLRAAHSEAIAAGMGVTEYAPHSVAAQEVQALVDEILRFRRKHAKQKASSHPPKATEARARRA